MSGSPVSFSVAIPTHNRAGTVVLAVTSALRQTRSPLEVLVIGDGCTDGTAEALSALGDDRVEFLDLPKGPGYGYSNRNEALRRARGDMVAWLGDDDLWLPDHLEHVGALADSEELDLVQVPELDVDEGGVIRHHANDLRVPEVRAQFIRLECGIGLPTVAHRPALAIEAGGWRDDPPKAGDRDLWIRMLNAGARTAMTGVPSVLKFGAYYRRQPLAERVVQNRDHLDLIGSPPGVARIRSRAAETISRDAVARWAEASAARSELERERAERAWLEERSATLDRVERGGWWRLRGRLSPLLGLVRRARRRSAVP